MTPPSTRRKFLKQTIFATLSAATLTEATGKPVQTEKFYSPGSGAYSVNIFSKNLHWLDYAGTAEVAASLGFDGVDITVRPQGHVEPERVAEDLPKAVAEVRKAGLHVHMITTAITDASHPFTESILKTASALGISCYRMGWLYYDGAKTMEQNLAEIAVRFKDLEMLNKKYGIRGDYQNHSGANFGSAVWDLWMILKQLDAQAVGVQYDVLHACVEGANSWVLDLKLLRGHVGSLDIKDFHWQKKETGWKAEVVPLGEGMVDYKKFFHLIKENSIRGPFSIHYEYPLGGAENGSKILTVPKETVLAAMKKDVDTLKKWLRDAELRS